MSDDNVIPIQRDTDLRVSNMTGAVRNYTTVIVDGREIPRLTMRERGDNIELTVDHRFSVDFPRDIAPQAAWLIAQALAIGAGYPWLGAQTKDRPFAPQVAMLGAKP